MNQREREAVWVITANTPSWSGTLDEATTFGVFFNFCWIPFVFYHLMQKKGYRESSPPSRYSWTQSLKYFCDDDRKRAMRCVRGGVANCPAMPEGSITSGTASLWQTVHPAGCWEKSLPLAVINEQLNLAAVSCLQYKSDSMALETTEIPKGWNSRVEKYHRYDGSTQTETPGWGDCILEGLFKRLEVTWPGNKTALNLCSPWEKCRRNSYSA